MRYPVQTGILMLAIKRKSAWNSAQSSSSSSKSRKDICEVIPVIWLVSLFFCFFFNMCFEALSSKHLGRLQDRWAGGRADCAACASFHSQPYLRSLISTCLGFSDAVCSLIKFGKVLDFISLVHAQGCNLDFKAMAPRSSCCGKSPSSVGKGTQSVISISKRSFNGCWRQIRGAHNAKFILRPVCQIPSQLLSTSVELKPSLFKMVKGQSGSSSLKLNLNIS